MTDGRRNSSGPEDESWTDVENDRPDLVEAIPIRYGTVLGGRYAVDKIIGRGGCGVVVRAHDRTLRVSVAIKIVRAELASERVWTDRLAREVKLARQIHHPHVCRVFDFEQADGRAFLVMELADNGSLRDEMRAGTTRERPWADRIADARAVASALAAIHSAGIVHRDLTPQNLLRMADGRLVLSDFGLATDAGESTTNVHGGTLTYMAPELLRGGRATFASDIWALGVVMHEIVFGERPRWRDGASSEMLPPELGRKLTRAERTVFETCRACTAIEARRRIASAAEAGRRLTEGGGWHRSRRPWVHPISTAAIAVALAAVATGVLWKQKKQKTAATANSSESPVLGKVGESADWGGLSTVLLEVPGRITCTRLLPDKRTIRFVWGTPPRAEDFNTATRQRMPSPIVPAAFAEGCPDLSSDGKHLLYQGHTPNGPAFAFLSQRPDGRDAVPVVQTAEPTMASEPTWLADGLSFSFDVDTKSMGTFFIRSGRMAILPAPTTKPVLTTFRHVIGNTVFVSAGLENFTTEFVGISVPSLREDVRFRLTQPVLDLCGNDRLLYSVFRGSQGTDLVELNLLTRQARSLGHIPNQLIRYPKLVGDAVAFVSIQTSLSLAIHEEDGSVSNVPNILEASHCGANVVVTKRGAGREVFDVIDRKGRVLRELTQEYGFSPICSPDGQVFFFGQTYPTRIRRCDRNGCRDLAALNVHSLSVSPDGKRLAIVSLETRGPIVWWMSAEGGDAHEVSETETACKPGWASANTLWISRRRSGKVIWTEVDTDSGRETGKTVPGTRECSDGNQDPASPIDPDLRITNEQTSQLRLLPGEFLGHG